LALRSPGKTISYIVRGSAGFVRSALTCVL
jgi:hypothetical protein